MSEEQYERDVIEEWLHTAEMFRRELRMGNKVKLFDTISRLNRNGADPLWLANQVNEVYGRLYSLPRKRAET